ncbi:hypothetical protein F511_02192 [Dorcoceras hygrometricum]|uniref:DNA topoisomerase n=1 Tax=Dorcoceras hygrometricum TaxID=472368 RepID=A0A2Z7ANC6_9LAMI|nr:hypothetical protein F511_02192 [Dorcoceras hygrometricum]
MILSKAGLENRALQHHSGICVRSTFANAETFEKCPALVRLPHALTGVQTKVLRIKSNSKIQLFRCHNFISLSFSSFNLKPQFKHGLSDTGMHMNVENAPLCSLPPTYFCSISKRPFCQVPRAGTGSRIVGTEDGGSGQNQLVKIFTRHRMRNKTFPGHKGKATSKEKMASAASVGEALGLKVQDVDLASSKVPIVQDNVDSLIGKSTQTQRTKVKAKRLSRSKNEKDQSSVATSTTGATDLPMNSKKVNKTKMTGNKESKSSPEFVEADSNPNTVTEVGNNGISVRSVSIETTKKSKRRGKSVTKGHTPSDGKVSMGQQSCLTNKNKSPGQKTWPQLYPPTTKSVLVVESATKAKVIQGYLGEMFEVVPSYGHVRDLAARSGSVRPDDDFSMVWEVPSAAWSHLKSIKVALSGADILILASDPDREGEAIAWHIIEMLHQQDALHDGITVARVVFNEITESSIKSALQAPREIDANLVDAYLARRALDYLIGFSVSPLLWRKLPGCQSAGRVQSAALALISDREKEIDEFNAQEYWTVEVEFNRTDLNSVNNVSFSSHLTYFDSKKLDQLSIGSHAEAKNIRDKICLSQFEVVGSKTSKMRRNPPTPYITSTLQQDAANKLNFSASYTMKLAQKLYEGVQLMDGKATGLITYMRTDGLHLSDEAAKDIQSLVIEKYGRTFAAKSTRKYFKKVKNAQEAHEAIRPTDIRRLPSMLGLLDEDSVKLYSLIWSRTMACQMEPAIIEQIQLDLGNANQSIMFRSTCSKVDFLGYQAVYEDAEMIILKSDDDQEKYHTEVFQNLSSLQCGQQLCLSKIELGQHYTQPPPRYSEGSLVKKLEELGIGRPSTYAITIKVLKDRHYITIKNRTLYPEFRGRMVSAFLSHYFSEVTDYSFTADMETELDNVSAGMTEWKGLLRDYWTRFSEYCENAGKVHIHHVEKMLEKTFGHFLFASFRDGNRTCPSCGEGTLVFKVSRFGAGYFIGCDQHPKCKYIAKTLYGEDDDVEVDPENKRKNMQEPKFLGLNPGSNEKVFLKSGPYGNYVQLGEDRKGHLPKRASLCQIKNVESITLEDALNLLQYPLTLGNHPDDDQPVILKLSRVGFTVRHRRTIASVPKNMRPSEITLEKALEFLKGKDVRRCGRPKLNKVVEGHAAAV